MHINILFAVLASDFGVELVVGEGPFREPPTVMQATIPLNQDYDNTDRARHF